MSTRVALLQTCSSDQLDENTTTLLSMIADAARQGAKFVATPEVSNCVSASRTHQNAVLQQENEDTTLSALQAAAQEHGIWLLIGSLALKTNDPDGRFSNRSFLIAPDGEIRARYDKIHMFDVQVSETETYKESAGYRPGNKAVCTETDFAKVGMTICYDVRFPDLYRQLAKAGAGILTVPSAFSPVTGEAHWESLLRARAIETGCFVLAPAQTGQHSASRGKPRKTYGHSMVISPWGEILLDAGTSTGVHIVDLDMESVAKARGRVPSLIHDRPFDAP